METINIGDKVMFKQSLNDPNKVAFTVLDITPGFVKIAPGAYGNKDMIIEEHRLTVVKA